ncbi:pyruvate kinase [Vicingaceae bacterium]|nr:pyruvate kinase [Vicingaceae bacterium]
MTKTAYSELAQPTRWKSLSDLTRTKTIATLGPACADRETIVELILQGVDIFRLNMAHGNREQHQQALQDIRWAGSEANVPVAILVDLAGPKIRLGKLFEDPFNCDVGSHLTFVRGENPGAANELVCTYENLVDEVSVGDEIMLRDGLVKLQVLEKNSDSAKCVVLDGGEIRSRQGVNLPGVRLTVSALGKVDCDNAIWACQNQVDFVSLSFVRTAEEICQLKKVLRSNNSNAVAIAKIEKREALDNLESIVEAADGIMVARGDLGVEIAIEKTPIVQKQIIRMCQDHGKPVIVATQMLESMHDSRQPTRAEVSDVANAILDGADACMLSGETAIGQFPRQSVAMMRKIMLETETILEGRKSRESRDRDMPMSVVSQAVVYGAAVIARRLKARMVVIATVTGESALVKSKQRDFVPTIAVTDSPETLRRMCLYWGITPVLTERLSHQENLFELVNSWSLEDYSILEGDRIICVVDSEMMPGIHDTVVVTEIGLNHKAT